MAVEDYYNEIQTVTEPAKMKMAEAATGYKQTLQSSGDLAGKLKQALNEKLNYNKDIIEQQGDSMQQYFAAPSAARAKYQDVWNPFERESLVANERTMALKPYAVLSDVLSQRMGSASDLVNSGVSGWQGVVGAAKNDYDMAANEYGSSLQEYLSAVGQDQWERDFVQKQSSGGSGSAGFSLEDILSLVGGLGGGATPGNEQPTEAKPQSSEAQISRMVSQANRVWQSPGGQWVFDVSSSDWVPVVD